MGDPDYAPSGHVSVQIICCCFFFSFEKMAHFVKKNNLMQFQFITNFFFFNQVFNLFIFFTVLAWHITSVMYSLYRKIRKDHRLQLAILYKPTTAAEEDPITTKV